jgi:hypothetical protein
VTERRGREGERKVKRKKREEREGDRKREG